MNNTSYAPAPPAKDPPPTAPQAQQHNAQAAAAQLALMQQLQQPQEQQPIVPTYTPSSNIFNQGVTVPVVAAAMNMNIQQQQAQSNNPPPPSSNLSSTTTTQQSIQSLPCTICKYPNCDIQIVGCNCLLHVRCCPIPIRTCPNPQCFNSSLNQNTNAVACQLELLPMEFSELDEARRLSDIAEKATAKAKEKSRARKKAKLEGGLSIMSSASGIVDAMMNDTPPQPQAPNSSDLRTGRWTTEETAYCDKLIQKFMAGRLPLPEGIKLNEFLSNMLKSKQSRLTKKMKNAKLSSKTFKRTTGYLTDPIEGSEFSESESAFFNSLNNTLDRSEIKFHMQKEWRETFSTYCVSYGQPLNVDRWLESVEEIERRVNSARDAERSIRRKMMMGNAMRQDLQNPDRGVVIVNDKPSPQQQQQEQHQQQSTNGQMFHNPNANVSSTPMMMHNNLMQPTNTTIDDDNAQSQGMGSPFLHRIMLYIQRNHIPFEYIDAWVPSFVPDASAAETAPSESSSVAGSDTGKQIEEKTKCRLCFAGSTVAKQVIVGDIAAGQTRRAVPMSADEQFNLSAFGDYSESFSFDVGCGLPGRVYHMGVPTWEQSVHNAPLHHFERVGGAQQWGIRTVVGIPVPSPNVGRVVVVLYSRHDRSKDHDLVIRLTEEFSRLLPSPKWKLIVDIGRSSQTATQQQAQKALSPENVAALTSEVISIFGEHMPSDQNDPAFAYLQGFMSLRLLLLRPSRSETEQDVVNTILSSYSSYKDGGRTRPDIALMLARDFIFLQESKQQTQQPVQIHQPIHQQQQFVSQQHSYTSNQSQMPPPSSPFGLEASSIMQQQQQPVLYQQVNQEQYQNSTEDHDAIAASLLGELGATDMVDLVVNNGDGLGDEQQHQMTIAPSG